MKKVISLMQPWATLLVMGIKKVETRSWATNYRGEILIHASNKISREAADFYYNNAEFQKYRAMLPEDELEQGKIIGAVDIVNVVKAKEWKWHNRNNAEDVEREKLLGDLSGERYAWVVKNPVMFKEPVPAKGALKIWDFKQCRQCGCSELDTCIHNSITCHWVEQDLCSHCQKGLQSHRNYQTFVTPPEEFPPLKSRPGIIGTDYDIHTIHTDL